MTGVMAIGVIVIGVIIVWGIKGGIIRGTVEEAGTGIGAGIG